MSLTNALRIALVITFITLLSLAWELRSFAVLLLATVFLAIFIATLLPQYKNISVPIISTGLMLTLGEFSIPYIVCNEDTLTQHDSSTSYGGGRYNERVLGFGYRPIPGVHTSRKLTSDGEVIYDVVYTIGEDGYRRDVNAEVFDAFIYGGSFTFGEGLNDDETIPYYLNEMYGIRTKNVGMHGYGLHQALHNVKHGITSSTPNGVNILLTAPWHALRSACKPSYAGGTPRYEVASNGVELVGVCAGDDVVSRVLAKSNIFSLASRALSNYKNRITDTDMDLYIAIIREIGRHSEENNARMIVAYMDATSEQLASTVWTNESLINELSRFSEVVDVTLADRREDLEAQYVIHELDVHPSAIANQKRAKILYHFINKGISE